MGRFKIRDLMIDLSGADQRGRAACPLNSFCPANSCGWTIILDPPQPCIGVSEGCAVCSLRLTTGCPPVSDCGRTPCHPAVTNTGPLDFFSIEDLELLKTELDRELRHVKTRLAEREEELQPRTLTEVDELESKLTEALEELRARRSELEDREG
ncbi:hypothetical protein [Streptomyces sp. NPDC048142]|uniref:hypothetical protein n=1 Tax=Streptomyces sp. NPDC048142 TaxID=3365501 RepID=UPI003715D929